MVNWTNDQLKAITQNGSDILVSAAAGSGKTAVLVERIVRKLLDENNPIDIDRMLVVTFTEAAASEMKEKIIRALKKEGSPRANLQLKMSGSACITTIDSFCLKCLRSNFHRIGIDPEFGICDKAEAELLKEEVCDELFDNLYKTEITEDKDRFVRMIDNFASNRNDYSLKNLVLFVYKFIQSFPEPEKWMTEKVKMYDLSADELFESEWICEIIDICKNASQTYLNEYSKLLEDMASICGDYSSVDELMVRYPYYDKSDKFCLVHEMYDAWAGQWNAVLLAVEATKMLSAVFDKENNKEIWDELFRVYPIALGGEYFPDVRIAGNARNNEHWYDYNARRKELNDGLKDALSVFECRTSDEIAHIISESKNNTEDIIWLVTMFGNEYMSQKEKKGFYEFSDIEHMTYNLFQQQDLCDEYREKYDEILIDEYQDTNGLQDAIFRSISKKNIFMVGDLKQSIYRFRGGDPSIFKEKSAKYSNGIDGVRIALSQNFRSRIEILDSVNSVFKAAMSDRVGDVVYENDECLCRENDYYTENGCDHKSELHIVPVFKKTLDDEDNMTVDRIEAEYVAGKIRKLIDEKYQVMCGMNDNGETIYRNIQYRDITILANSVKYIGDVYSEALLRDDIPVFVENENYFDRKEITLVLSLLRVINNYRQDIPLIALMRSVIGGFSDDELSRIRYANRHTENFYDAVCLYDGKYDDLKEKCKEFVQKLDKWRSYMKYKTVAGLLWSLYEETGLYDFMGALEGGDEAQANLRLLYERAKQYEDNGFKGVFNFIKYMERLENRGEDVSSAKIIGENHNVVRLMTIHKSKGLEFPVVFVVGAGKEFRKGSNDSMKFLNLHKDAGFGMQYIDVQNGYYSETIPYKHIKRLNAEEGQSENLRKLYVGLTRPKEKLFVIATMKFADGEKFQSRMDKWTNICENGKLPEEFSVNARGFFDWIIPAAINDTVNWRVEIAESVREDSESISDILSYKYPYADCCRLPSKTTVSAIKQKGTEAESYSSEYSMSKRPRFIETAPQSNDVGTAHHKIMAYINPKSEMDDDYILSEIERIYDMGEIQEADKESISVDFIRGFFENDLGKRMIEANRKGLLKREAPFEISVKANVYEPVLYGNPLYDDDEIIVQGAIDCYFEEDDGIVLIDYKTDKFRGRADNPEEIKAFTDKKVYDYTVQVELYREAIETITGKKVKEKYLYLFSTSSLVKL